MTEEQDPDAPTTYPMPDELLPLFMDSDGKRFVPGMWWFSFDTFVVKLTAMAARKLASGMSYPGNTTPEEWSAYLIQIAEDLEGYDKFAYMATSDPSGFERVQDAMRRFIDRMDDWWD